MTDYTILLNGDVSITERLQQQIIKTSVIIADGGIRHLDKLSIAPEFWPKFWIGDFDSAPPALLEKHNGLQRINYPVDKDKTDGQLAIEMALENGAKKLILCGALGGSRTDHSLFHMAYALSLAKQGIEVILTSGHEEAYPILAKDYQFDLPLNAYLSVFGFGNLHGLTLAGVKWPLQNRDMRFGTLLTLSNEVTDKVSLSLTTGEAILMISFKS